MSEEKKNDVMGIWRYRGVKGGKFLVVRRDGTIPLWPHMVLGARDPAAPQALFAYARKCEELGYNKDYVSDIRRMADDFVGYLREAGEGDPESPPHRTDNPVIIQAMVECGDVLVQLLKNYRKLVEFRDEVHSLLGTDGREPPESTLALLEADIACAAVCVEEHQGEVPKPEAAVNELLGVIADAEKWSTIEAALRALKKVRELSSG